MILLPPAGVEEDSPDTAGHVNARVIHRASSMRPATLSS
jgi:hypothetical protein